MGEPEDNEQVIHDSVRTNSDGPNLESVGDVGTAEPNVTKDENDADEEERKDRKSSHRKRDKKDSRRRDDSRDRDHKRHKRRHHSRDRSKERSSGRSRHRSDNESESRKERDADTTEKKKKISDDEPEDKNSSRKGSRSPSRSSRRRDKDRDEKTRHSSRDRDHSSDRRRRRRSPSGSRRRHRHSPSRSSSRDRYRRRDRSRERDRDSSYRRRRSRSDSRDRHRSRDNRRDRDRNRDDRRDRERDNRKKDDEIPEEDRPKVTLKDIIAQNPGLSVTEALQQLHAINAANAMGATGPGGAPLANPMALSQATKLLREVYVGGIPPGITITQLTDFVNKTMKEMNLCQTSSTPFGGPVVTCWISTDGHYAFVEFRTVEEATAALNNLGGVMLGVHQLKVGRPKSNGASIGAIAGLPLGLGTVVAPTAFAPSVIGLGSGGIGAVASTPTINTAEPVAPSSDCIMVSNLPESIGEAEVRELLDPFGEIKAFNFIKVNAGVSKGGAAVLEYADKSVTDGAVKGLNGLSLGDFKLSVQRVPAQMASMLLAPTPSAAAASSANTSSVVGSGGAQSGTDPLLSYPPSCVLRLSNMTAMEDLVDDELYDELTEDVGDECNNYGTVRSIVIPRPGSDSSETDASRGVGLIFVSFTSPEGATRARKAVNGRTFNGQTVVAVFYPEKLFESKVYKLPDDFSADDGDGDEDELN